MPKIIRCCLIAFGVIVVVSLIWIFRPYAQPDEQEVSEHLSELKEPYKSVESAYFMDGGSLGIRIIDSEGKVADFCLRADFGEDVDRHERLYYGAVHYTKEPSKEVSNPSATIDRLLQILRQVDGVDHERDIVVASASGRWRDYCRILWRKFISREY